MCQIQDSNYCAVTMAVETRNLYIILGKLIVKDQLVDKGKDGRIVLK
jgi:hypothetical protein